MIRALIDHLWQSTLFGAAIWSITLALRSNAAAVRHGLWLLASLKFLVPFSALYLAGSAAGLFTPVETEASLFGAAVQAATPMISPSLSLSVAPARDPSLLFPALVTAWALVALGLGVRWLRNWREADLLSRAARPAPGSLPDARVTDADVEPAVARVFNPVVLLPSALLGNLSPAQLDAVMAHERAHIARHDNLKAHLHSLVEILFWFHPLVWFISRQLMEERERACDESVLEHGHDPGEYAAGILAVCRHCATAHQRHAVAAIAGDLTTRIRHILGDRPPLALGFTKAFLLSACTLAVGAIPFAAGAMDDALHRHRVLADNTRALWEADIEVRPVGRGDGGDVRIYATGNEVTIQNTTLRQLVAIAYGVRPWQVEGSGDWLDALRYDIRAHVPGAVSEPENLHPYALRGMVNKLLSSRFDLEIYLNKECQTHCGQTLPVSTVRAE
ncbi:MAG TPA: M56 family metallopeptidase [Steroidobacteraceae bacterium]|jgi:beta-lactamase regulating signal transducer with metallopeptidase domain|nr:M56 family metallopeptidase [Steroidobacteraceae bacterium]